LNIAESHLDWLLGLQVNSGYKGFRDEQSRVAQLQDRKQVLKQLTESIPRESFRPLLDQGYTHNQRNKAGIKKIDPLILFKMLDQKQLFNLSDERLELQLNDRRSFEEFVGLEATLLLYIRGS